MSGRDSAIFRTIHGTLPTQPQRWRTGDSWTSDMPKLGIQIPSTHYYSRSLLRGFLDFPIFPPKTLGGSPRKITLQELLGTMGLEPTDCRVKILHLCTSNSSRGRMRTELWRFKGFRTFLGDSNPPKPPSRGLQTLWEQENRVLL